MEQRGRPSREVRSREELARSVVISLAKARREAGLTRRRLSELSGVSGHTIAKIEQAAVTDPGFAVVAALAGALELPLNDLLHRARRALDSDGRVGSAATQSADRIRG